RAGRAGAQAQRPFVLCPQERARAMPSRDRRAHPRTRRLPRMPSRRDDVRSQRPNEVCGPWTRSLPVGNRAAGSARCRCVQRGRSAWISPSGDHLSVSTTGSPMACASLMDAPDGRACPGALARTSGGGCAITASAMAVGESAETLDAGTELERTAERSVSPVELLWDLVFVFAVTQVGTLLSRGLTWEGFGRSML